MDQWEQTFGETIGRGRGASALLLLDWDGLMLMLSVLGTSPFKSEPSADSGSKVSGNGTTSGHMFRSVLMGYRIKSYWYRENWKKL